MNCRELTSFLEQYVDEDLPADVRIEFESHLHACGNCVTYMEQYRAVITATRACYGETPAEPPPMPEDLVQLIMKTLGRES
jgi:anti-sigma factor RsiW